MRAAAWFRAAAVVLLLFAVGHTYGFLAFRPDTAEGRAVWEAMNSVRFSAGSSTFSYGGFYKGFGLFISSLYLFGAWLAWTLGSMVRAGEMAARRIAWGCLCCSALELCFRCSSFRLGLRCCPRWRRCVL
ncbi:LIC_13387 family protein [Tunturiibacter empetritectus]|uniref:LIC_13387 family protein n=1 Tax=Tunturiibacter empetritectus TaxID=3069691 RepID=UPI003DA74014